MKLIANKGMYYGGRMVQAEEAFECDERFVDVLVLSLSARKVKEEEEGRRKNRGYKRRDMIAEAS